jgi:hypothetical protein
MMGLSINSHAVLRSFADHPEIYPAIQPDLAEIARKLLLKQLKAKSTDAAQLRRLCEVAGADTLAIIFDSMTENELIGLIKRVDPHSPYGKAGSDSRGARAHVGALAAGRAELSTKPAKVTAPKKSKAAAKEPVSKIGEILGSKVHSGAPRKPRKKSS